jgi:hypothetical protein
MSQVNIWRIALNVHFRRSREINREDELKLMRIAGQNCGERNNIRIERLRHIDVKVHFD